MKRTFVFGDIHGCHRSLIALLDLAAPDMSTDTLIFLGDYVNRGPDSRRVIDHLLALRRQSRRVITLMGNHEQMFLGFLQGEESEVFLRNGGEETLESYGIKKPLPTVPVGLFPPDHVAFVNDLMLYWEDDEYIFVHAGLQPGVHLSQQSPAWLLWARDRFIHSNHDFGKRVIYGHTPFDQPKVEDNKIGIDTGAVYGGKLSCLVLPEMRFISV